MGHHFRHILLTSTEKQNNQGQKSSGSRSDFLLPASLTVADCSLAANGGTSLPSLQKASVGLVYLISSGRRRDWSSQASARLLLNLQALAQQHSSNKVIRNLLNFNPVGIMGPNFEQIPFGIPWFKKFCPMMHCFIQLKVT